MDVSKVVLEVNQLSIGIQNQAGIFPAINALSFSIQAGVTFALLGESGCGKTMTALSISQLLPQGAHYYENSQIKLEGSDLLTLSEIQMRQFRGKKIGMIFQEPMTSLNPVLTIGHQISETLAVHNGYTNKSRKEKVIALLNAVGIPDAKMRYHHYPHQLSGGQKQRVMIAMSIAIEPLLLIADEPTTALDVTIQAQILELLAGLQLKTQMAILLITHDLGVVSEIAHQVAVMYAGEIVELTNTSNFFQDPLHPYSKKLFAVIPHLKNKGKPLLAIPGNVPNLLEVNHACSFANRCQFVFSDCHSHKPMLREVKPDHWVRCHLYDPAYMTHAISTGPELKTDDIMPTQRHSKENHVLIVEDLKVYFPIEKGLLKRTVGEIKAVDGVSFELTSGKTLALVGESGCGKTTLGKAILRLIEPTGGRVYFDGDALSLLSKHHLRLLRKLLQFIFQDPYSALDPRMNVLEIIAEGMKAQRSEPRAVIKEKVQQLLKEVGLPTNILYRYPHAFSGGQRQRISIARALAVKPQLIICDEPTSALDLSVQAQILNLLKKLQHEFNLSYLFISHNISVVSYMADEILVMYLGRIVEQGPTAALLKQPKHPYTQALLSAVPNFTQHHDQRIHLKGEQPSPVHQPTGCHFHPRCPKKMDICEKIYPEVTIVGENHRVNCYLYNKGASRQPSKFSDNF